jgi:monofunctional biosynthetic peptidoglycan transglycosylase
VHPHAIALVVMRLLRSILRTLARALLALVLVSVALVILYRYVDPPITPLMLVRAVEAGAGGRRADIDQRWRPLEDISPALLQAVVAAEDARFFQHWGVDVDALLRAYEFNQAHHDGRLRGGSTITMQCARSTFLWPGRTYLRKALEIPLAVLMEQLWGKRRVLEIYLNVVEWGEGVYGAEAAAERSFGVPAARLDLEQAALMAAALPAPRRFDPGRPTAYLQRRANVIARRVVRRR